MELLPPFRMVGTSESPSRSIGRTGRLCPDGRVLALCSLHYLSDAINFRDYKKIHFSFHFNTFAAINFIIMKAKLVLLLFALVTGNTHLFAQTVQAGIPGANDAVNSIVRYNNTIYVGGEFDSVGTSARNYLAAIDANTGTATTAAPVPMR